MKERNMFIAMLLLLIIIASLVFIYNINYSTHIKIIKTNITIEKPMLLYDLSGFYINSLNSNENLIDGWIFNYGFEEAKDVELTCMILSSKEELLKKKIESAGNIASVSYKFIEVKIESAYEYNTTAACVITNCSNCIMLERRMPDFKKYYDLAENRFLISKL